MGLGHRQALFGGEQVWRLVQFDEGPGQRLAISAPVPAASRSSPSAGEPVYACSGTGQ